ncbi:MAG: hypothetical protein ABI588_04080 [Arenimonas sp.]
MAEPKLARSDALAYLKRFPAQGPLETAINLAAVLAGNGIVLWLMASGQLRAAHLIALVMVECVLLIAMSWGLQRLVPRKDWLEPPKPWRERVGVLLFLLFWLCGAYSITLLVVGGVAEFLALRSPRAWIDAQLHWPLLYTLGFALWHGVDDLLFYRRQGGKFQSNLSQDAMARLLTLILGAIPFAMPFFAFAIGGFKGVEFIVRRARVSPRISALAGLAMLAVAGGSFAVVGWLATSGATGWAIGFVFAKLIAEVFLACMPLVMVQVARETAAPTPAQSRMK